MDVYVCTSLPLSLSLCVWCVCVCALARQLCCQDTDDKDGWVPCLCVVCIASTEKAFCLAPLNRSKKSRPKLESSANKLSITKLGASESLSVFLYLLSESVCVHVFVCNFMFSPPIC
jgi:hypothetical protein